MTYVVNKPWNFGYKFGDETFYNNHHNGLDFIVPVGTTVYAMHSGTVVQSYFSKTLGHAIRLSGGGFETLYGHNSQRMVKIGEEVREGQIIAYSGNTGLSTGPHLHLELKVNGKLVNPLPYLEEEVTQKQKDFEKIVAAYQQNLERYPESDKIIEDQINEINRLRNELGNEDKAWRTWYVNFSKAPEVQDKNKPLYQ